MPGGDLQEALRSRQTTGQGPYDEQQAIHMVSNVAEGLAALHQAGILHRDIKLANILLNESGIPTLADFGIAVQQERQVRGTILGSAHYMAPEAMQGQALTPAADVYSLAICLFELLTGEKPFQRSAKAIRQNNIDIVAGPSVRCYQPSISQALDEVLQRALSVDPLRRYPDAHSFIDALHHTLQLKPRLKRFLRQ